jgi:hypothetical protein
LLGRADMQARLSLNEGRDAQSNQLQFQRGK